MKRVWETYRRERLDRLIPPENVVFSATALGSQGKGVHMKALGITCHFDDRPDILDEAERIGVRGYQVLAYTTFRATKNINVLARQFLSSAIRSAERASQHDQVLRQQAGHESSSTDAHWTRGDKSSSATDSGWSTDSSWQTTHGVQMTAAVIVKQPPHIRETRFDHRRAERWFRCDRCGDKYGYEPQGFPFDSKYVEYDGSLKTTEWWAAWGEWYRLYLALHSVSCCKAGSWYVLVGIERPS